MEIVVGIGESAISDHQDDILKIIGLGPCVAVSVYALRRQVLGLAHIPLPYANPDADPFTLQLGRYVNTALPALLNKMKTKFQCLKSELSACIIGGAQSAQPNDLYKIGEKNVEAAKNILARYNLPFTEFDTGGNYVRSLAIDVATGSIMLKRFRSAPPQDETDCYHFASSRGMHKEGIDCHVFSIRHPLPKTF